MESNMATGSVKPQTHISGREKKKNYKSIYSFHFLFLILHRRRLRIQQSSFVASHHCVYWKLDVWLLSVCVCVNIHAIITTTLKFQTGEQTTMLRNISISFISSMFSIYIKLHKLRHNSQVIVYPFGLRHETKKKVPNARTQEIAKEWAWEKWPNEEKMVIMHALCAVSSWFMNRKSVRFPATECGSTVTCLARSM